MQYLIIYAKGLPLGKKKKKLTFTFSKVRLKNQIQSKQALLEDIISTIFFFLRRTT